MVRISGLFTSGLQYYNSWFVAFGMTVNGSGQYVHVTVAVRFDTKEEVNECYYNYLRLVRSVQYFN